MLVPNSDHEMSPGSSFFFPGIECFEIELVFSFLVFVSDPDKHSLFCVAIQVE